MMGDGGPSSVTTHMSLRDKQSDATESAVRRSPAAEKQFSVEEWHKSCFPVHWHTSTVTRTQVALVFALCRCLDVFGR